MPPFSARSDSGRAAEPATGPRLRSRTQGAAAEPATVRFAHPVMLDIAHSIEYLTSPIPRSSIEYLTSIGYPTSVEYHTQD